jgi:HD-GYP domain-containing protein (c-di-GMP phosphodiesterase class II)
VNQLTHSCNTSRIWVCAVLFIGFLVSSGFGVMGAYQVPPSNLVGRLFYDTIVKQLASGETAQNVIVIDIDDSSIQSVGQWPWPRYKIASLIQAIDTKKPAAIAVDILFSEPDRTSLSNIKQVYKRDLGLDITFSGAPLTLQNNDEYLGTHLEKSGAVGASYFYFDHINSIEASTKPEFQISGRTDLLTLSEATGISQNFYKQSSQLKFSGFINTQPDDDGMLRSLPLLIRYKGVIYPHLCLAAFMRAQGTNSATIGQDVDGPTIRVGHHVIPIKHNGLAMLRFNGKSNLYPSISAIDVLNGLLKASEVEGKTVLIGSSAVGLHDLHSTVFDSQFPGSKIQAAMIENMANGSHIREPSWAGIAILVSCIFSGLLISLIFIYADKPILWTTGTLLVTIAISSACILLFNYTSAFISPSAPFLVILVLFLFFSIARFLFEKRRSSLRLKKLENMRMVTIASMSAVAETRHHETGAHIKRTQHYVKAIAEQLQKTEKYSQVLTDEYIDMLFVSAPLHDIGKVGVPDNIFLKPGKLSPVEMALMKKHAELGKRMIYDSWQKAEDDDILEIAGEIALTHHEKWDGTGYPLGLSGLNIPLSGRIMAVADVYDALISDRCYKAAFSHEVAKTMMLESRAKAFDPEVLDAFLDIEDTILAIATTFKDKPNILLDIGSAA